MVGPRPVGTVAGSTDGRATVLPSTTQFDGKSGTVIGRPIRQLRLCYTSCLFGLGSIRICGPLLRRPRLFRAPEDPCVVRSHVFRRFAQGRHAGRMSFGFVIYPRSRKSPHRAQGAPLPPHPPFVRVITEGGFGARGAVAAAEIERSLRVREPTSIGTRIDMRDAPIPWPTTAFGSPGPRSLSKLRGREPGYGPRREFDCCVVGTQWSVCRRQQPL